MVRSYALGSSAGRKSPGRSRWGRSASSTNAPHAGRERQVSTAELVGALRDKQARNPDQPVVISADKDVRYEAVLKVMDELQKNNIRRVGLMVKAATR